MWVEIKSKERECRKKSGSSPCGGVGWNNYIWDELLSESGFIPIRGCRLKFPLRFSNFSPLGVHPHAGVWIEIIFLLSQVLTKKFIPIRGCGLKLRFRASSTSGTPFIPIRGCELKCRRTKKSYMESGVHPHTGVWVVISILFFSNKYCWCSSPCGGVSWNFCFDTNLLHFTCSSLYGVWVVIIAEDYFTVTY